MEAHVMQGSLWHKLQSFVALPSMALTPLRNVGPGIENVIPITHEAFSCWQRILMGLSALPASPIPSAGITISLMAARGLYVMPDHRCQGIGWR
jgi:hypothetical protein